MSLFSNNSIFVIAEMANAHEGELEKAKKITLAAAKAGANAIKYQKFTANELAEPTHEFYSLYKKLEMTKKEWTILIKFAKKCGLKVFADVFGINSAKSCLDLGIDGFKIHSSDLMNPSLLRFLSKEKTPLLLSTGGCFLNEIDEAIKILQSTPKEIVLMHGFQGYPTKLSDLNLNKIKKLKEKYLSKVGIMDHVSGGSELSLIIPIVGIGMGATIIEKHITLNRDEKGLDYFSSLNPDEFKKMVLHIKKIEKTFGKEEFELSKNELTYRLAHKKNPIAKKSLKKGTKLDDHFFNFKRTKSKNSVSLYDFRGTISSKNISKGNILTKDMIDKKSHKIAAVIACRVHSTRLFAKQMQLVGDRPIIDHMIYQLKTSKMITDIVLAISSRPGNEVFVDYARKNGIKFVIGDDTDVLKRLINGAKYVNADIIFRITPENPYIYWEGIDEILHKHISGDYDFSTCFNVPLGTGYEVVKLSAFEKSHKDGLKKHRSELCSLYIRENIKKFKIFHISPPKEFQRPEIRLTVDTPEDLYVARSIYDALGKKQKLISLKNIILFLDKNPELTKINSGVPLDVSRIWIDDDPLKK
jgi:N,N'-diacetyllegionaminate synthase